MPTETKDFLINDVVLDRTQWKSAKNNTDINKTKLIEKREEYLSDFEKFKTELIFQKETATEDCKKIINNRINQAIQEASAEGEVCAKIFLYSTTNPTGIEESSVHALILTARILEWCTKNNLIGWITCEQSARINNVFLNVRWL